MTAEEILKEFQRERPQPVPVLPQGQEDEIVIRQPAEGRDQPAMRQPDGHFLVDRVGRLSEEGAWWVIHYVADNNPAESPDPPMKLLPNRMLERMIRESEGSSRGVTFVVSGEVTEFMGENYLLLRKLMRRREMGNLSN